MGVTRKQKAENGRFPLPSIPTHPQRSVCRRNFKARKDAERRGGRFDFCFLLSKFLLSKFPTYPHLSRSRYTVTTIANTGDSSPFSRYMKRYTAVTGVTLLRKMEKAESRKQKWDGPLRCRCCRYMLKADHKHFSDFCFLDGLTPRTRRTQRGNHAEVSVFFAAFAPFA
jgi:hypothetical protein